MTEKLLFCSFCNKSNEEVRKMVASSKAIICDECIATCCDILIDEGMTELTYQAKEQSYSVYILRAPTTEFKERIGKLADKLRGAAAEIDGVLARFIS